MYAIYLFIYKCFSLHTVPPPQITITGSPTIVPFFNAGIQFNLTCSIQLDPAVDTKVSVTAMWYRSGTLHYHPTCSHLKPNHCLSSECHCTRFVCFSFPNCNICSLVPREGLGNLVCVVMSEGRRMGGSVKPSLARE